MEEPRADAVVRLPGVEAPPYFIECLVYNIDHAVFPQPLYKAYPACVNWLDERRNTLDGFTCRTA